MAAGFAAGITEALVVVTPFEVVKIRLQQQRGLTKELLRYKARAAPFPCIPSYTRSSQACCPHNPLQGSGSCPFRRNKAHSTQILLAALEPSWDLSSVHRGAILHC